MSAATAATAASTTASTASIRRRSTTSTSSSGSRGPTADARGLDASGILLEKGEAKSLHVAVGSRIKLLSNSRTRATVTVRGIYKDDALMTNGIDHERPAPAPHPAHRRPVRVRDDQIRQRRGEGREASRKDRLAAQFPTADLKSNAEFKQADRRPDQPGAVPDLRPARRERADLGLRHRQHALCSRCTSARARSACCARSA